jgi:hypothetical protein
MNFTPWDTINEAINAGAKYWSVYDQSGKRLIFELQQDTAPEDSAEKLKAILNREAGEFVQVRLSFQSVKDKGNGGNTRGFNYFYKLPNPGGSITGPMQYNGGGASIGVPLETYLGVLKECNDLKIEYDRLKNATPSLAQTLGTPENINKAFDLIGIIASSLNNKNKPAALIASPDQFDKETTDAVNTLLTFQDGRQALINIAAAGPLVWAMIHQGLIDNKLLP